MEFRRWFVLAALCGLLGLFSPIGEKCLGQDRSTSDARLEAKIAELEKRIKELEAPRQSAAPVVLPAPPPQEAAKIAELEKRIRELETTKPVVSAVAPGKAGLGAPVSADNVEGPAGPAPATGIFGTTPAWNAFKDGFIIHSADNQHQLRVTGQIQTDMRVYPRHGDFTDNDTFLVRRARLGIEATVFDYYEFRFLPDWGNNKSVIQDAYLNVHYWDQFQLQAGKFKEPVSYEQLIQDRFVPTLERSLIDQIVPARDVGFMVHGQKVLNGQFEYAAGFFNGEPNSDLDTNKIKDFAGRLAWKPLNYEFLPDVVRPLQIGVSGTIGKEQEALNFNG